jgi:hypothetical protein
MTTIILEVLTGSQAHGLARPDSDTDFRSVYYTPTNELLVIPVSGRPRFNTDVEGHAGDGWEVEQALTMAARSHPSAMELAFWKPTQSTPEGLGLSIMMAQMMTRQAAVESTIGYVKNCLTKLLAERQKDREAKWKATYLRTLFATERLVSDGYFPMEVPEKDWGEVVRAALANELTVGQVLDIGRSCEARLERAIEFGEGLPDTTPMADRWARANEWLREFRREHFDD